MASTRRLAAILAADVAGYSRLMGVDEEGTLERLKAHRRQLIDPKIAEHRGRIVKTTGDGLLAEFPSVVDAVRCAAEAQRGMLDREPEVPDERRIRFRIGINLGDVIAEGDDIFGEAIPWLEKARRANPKYAGPRWYLACAYGLKGELDRAAAELAEAERLLGSDKYSTIARVRENGPLNTPALRDRFEGIFLAGLRKAGLPEE